MTISALDPSTPGSSSGAGRGDDEIRALKQALKDTFGGVDGPVEAGGGNGLATAAQLTALFDRLAAVEGTLSGSGGAIPGECKLFYGEFDDIPSGWYHMDGTNGTPDWRGRSPINANSTSGLPTFGGQSQGGTEPTAAATTLAGAHDHGGTNGHALTVAQLPDIEGNLRLSLANTTTNSSDDHDQASNVARGATASDSDQTGLISTSGMNGASHSHGISTAGDHAHTFNHQREPWAAAYWIMYTGA